MWNGNACTYIKANILVAIFSGPGQFTITRVSIGVDNDLINVTCMQVSHVTIYGHWCMLLANAARHILL